MKRLNLIKFLFLGLVLSVCVAGCKKRPQGPTPIPGRTGGPSGAKPDEMIGSANPIPVPSTVADQSNTTGGIPLNPLSEFEGMVMDPEFFKKETIYFEYDRAALKASETAKVENVANYLKQNMTEKVKVDGHCDERGTEEYNRSLGERRALTVRTQLVRLGVTADRIRTLSYGEDMPADPGHDEAAWGKNRRAEFVLLKPKQ